MIDYFALALTHALILIALLRIVSRPELDSEDPVAEEAAAQDAPKLSRREEMRARRERRGTSDA